MIELLLASCAICGLAIASYFSLVYYDVLEPDNRWIPFFCRMERQSCIYILSTPQAKVFRVPNSVLGVLYYAAILVLPISVFEIYFLIASIFAVGIGMYLVHALIVKLRTPCPLCYTAHGINLVIANLLIVREIQAHFVQ